MGYSVPDLGFDDDTATPLIGFVGGTSQVRSVSTDEYGLGF
jgi:hypothetical protein